MTGLAFERDLPEVLTKADNLPSLPAVAVEVLALAQDDDSTIDDLAECLGRDPALAAKLLKLSNSSLFSVGGEITTLQRATMVLGMKTVKLMSLSFSLAGSVPSEGTEAGFDVKEYWSRSLVNAVAARALARLVQSQQNDEAFLCGLLGHFGRLVLARALTDEYEDVVRQCGGWPSHADEERLLGFSNTDVCATLLKSWDLPLVIYMAVGHWHRPEELPADVDPLVGELARLLEVTSLVEAILCDQKKGEPLERLHELAERYYQLDEAAIDEFLVGLAPGIAEAAEMLSIQLPAGRSYEDVMNEARVQLMEVSLGTAVDLHHTRQENERLEEERAALETRAHTDKLTGLPNRAAFDDFMEQQVAARLRGKLPRALGLVLLDIDRFKNFNDTYGHTAGDEVLRMVGSVLERETRGADLSARYGGEEFVIVAPQTNTFGLKTLAERLRRALERETLDLDGTRRSVTASFGAACIAEFESMADARVLFKLADRFLYKAKENGRNRCETYKNFRFPGR